MCSNVCLNISSVFGKGYGYDYEYNYASVIYDSQWNQNSAEVSNASYSCEQIYNLFAQQMIWRIIYVPHPITIKVSLYGHLENYYARTTKDMV